MQNLSLRRFGLILGPLLFVVVYFGFHPEGLSDSGRAVLATTLWVAIWWITEAIPIAATGILPMVLFPLSGALAIKTTTAAYASPMIFLFMGGFMLAVAIEKWNLHRRIALSIISWVGSDWNRIILGFMLATAFLSMWISNTATAVMMMPIGVAVVRQLGKTVGTKTTERQLGQALMLGIAYGCSIGGMATIIGTPTNVIFTGVVDELYGVEIAFSQWMLFGLPITLLLLFLAWIYLVKIAFTLPTTGTGKDGRMEIRRQLKELGTMSDEEAKVLVVFVLVALAWISRSFLLQQWIPGINDTVIAIGGALILFLIPSKNKPGDYLLDWQTAERIPWGILLLFGGGLALAAGFKETGLATFIGNQLRLLDQVPYLLLLLLIIAAVNFLTEITSNVATASMLMPILAALALSIGVHPFGLMVATTVAASCAFMLPVATPPNAVVFGSGYLTIPDMMRVGLRMNLLSIVLLTLFVYYVLPLVWGIDLHHFPEALRPLGE